VDAAEKMNPRVPVGDRLGIKGGRRDRRGTLLSTHSSAYAPVPGGDGEDK
jgi:hypothetical protein